MGKEANFACMKAGDLLVPCSVCLIQAEAPLALPYNDQLTVREGEFCLYGTFGLTSSLLKLSTKVPLIIINAQKPAETGKVLKLAHCFHVSVGRACVIQEIIVWLEDKGKYGVSPWTKITDAPWCVTPGVQGKGEKWTEKYSLPRAWTTKLCLSFYGGTSFSITNVAYQPCSDIILATYVRDLVVYYWMQNICIFAGKHKIHHLF